MSDKAVASQHLLDTLYKDGCIIKGTTYHAIVFAVRGTWASDKMERRPCWHTVEVSKLVIRKSLGV